MEQVLEKPKTKKKKQKECVDKIEEEVQVNQVSNEKAGHSRILDNIECDKRELIEDLNEDLSPKCSQDVKVEEHHEVNVNIDVGKIEHKKSLEFDQLLNKNKELIKTIVVEEVFSTSKNTTIQKCQQAEKIFVKPYTELQLSALYTNTEISTLESFTKQFIEAELKGLAVKQHPLHELLSNYLKIRNKITGNTLELEQLRTEYSQLENQLWTTELATVTGKGQCQDGTHVTTTHQYQKATFHRSIFQSILRVFSQIRKSIYENYTLYAFTAEDLRLQIELYIQSVIGQVLNLTGIRNDFPVRFALESEPQHLQPYLSELRLSISVLFAFQRKQLQHESQFLQETQAWLSKLVAVLLRLANYQDHLFLLNHILRCPPGVGRWGASFIQIPLDSEPSPFQSPQINHLLTIFQVLLSPIDERDKFLDDLTQNEELWILVDSDGEEDEEAGRGLRENDLVALVSQLPLENLFRSILLVEKRNYENYYQMALVTENHILRFFAFSSTLLKIINKGLQTYSQVKYNQFAKRLSRLIRHLVQYATDQYEQFQLHNQLEDKAMLSRLQVEYDAFFLRAIEYLYNSQKLGAWQFLAVIPYHLITNQTVWNIFYFLHNDSNLICGNELSNIKFELWQESFRQSFEEKIAALADDELYYLLNTFANMALARHENDFIEAATIDLLNLGFISEATQENCSKTARSLLTHITSKHPVLLSIILRLVRENINKIDCLALYLYEELPITIWQLTEFDLATISFLLTSTIASNESKMARMILSRLNWDLLPYEMHEQVALLVLKVCDFENGYTNWGWQTILRLKLHVSDKKCNLRQILEPNNYEILMKGLNQNEPLASFVSLLMTTFGHLVPVICTDGLKQLLILQTNQKHEAVLFALYLIIPLFLNSQEFLINNEKFQLVITNLINADRGYISMAKSLISVQKTVLEQFGNMIESQIVNFSSYELSTPRCLVRLWINTLVSISNWSRDEGVLFLLDVILRAAFFHQEAFSTVLLIFKELQPVQASSGIGSLFKWVSSNPSSSPLIAVSLTKYHWLAFVLIELEYEEKEKRTGLWHELLLQLIFQKGKISVDAALKKAASIVKVGVGTSSQLCIYRWAQQAMDAPVDHPLALLIWQKFFTLYLHRLPVGVNATIGCVGERFFDGLINFAFLKRIKRKLQETCKYYQDEFESYEKEDEKKIFFENCFKLARAFCAWLEEPMLQKSNLLLPALPALYQANLLAFIIQGSCTLWYEYLDYEKIKREQDECVRIWQLSNFRQKKNINQPLINPGKSMESDDPIVRILRRLTVYEAPKPLPDIKNQAPIIPNIDFSTKDAMFSSLEQCFKSLAQSAHLHTLKLSEHKALDCSYQDLIPQLYRSVLNKVTKKIPCKGRNDTVNCSGAAIIILEMQEARINDRIQHQIQTNRFDYESLMTKSLQTPATALCTAAVTIQHAIKILQVQFKCNPASAELGSNLFYHILSLISEETIAYPPTKTLFATCLDRLGHSHISNVESEMPKLLKKIISEPHNGIYLAPHFSPSNITTQNLLDMYFTISNQVGNNFDTAFTLLSKFEIDKWLEVKEPKLNQRSDFIRNVVNSLTLLGIDPPLEAGVLHGLYRRHLLTIFGFQFPEHYGEVLVCLLKASNGTDGNLLAPNVWLDVLNFMSPIELSTKLPLREQLRQYAQLQKLLQHQELLESGELFAKHFTHERLQYGLYGLYPKCRNYVEIFGLLLGLTSHGLIVSTLNVHQGLLGDKLTTKIWPYLINLYAPWIVPYSIQNLKDNMASWIQQLADDRSILLPWIPSDSLLAQKMIQSFYESLQFLIHTIPTSTNILSFIWQWYVSSFAHVSIKDHILGPIHQSFVAFPWENFWPTVADLESMLRVIDQYLPECHSFLSTIFMSVNWTVWLHHFKTSPIPIKTRVYHCFVNLVVKLSNEPNVRNRQSEKLKRLLLEAENGDWDILTCGSFQQVMDWWVLSCDSNVIYKSDPLDVDFRVLFFLKNVSGYNRIIENDDSVELHEKRLIFVKAFTKLVQVNANRYKSTIHTKLPELKTVITNQLLHFENVVRTSGEMNAILPIILHILNIDNIAESLCECFTNCLTNKLGNSIIIKSCLQTLGACVGDNSMLAILLETTLTSYFQNNVNEFVPSWNEISTLLIILSEKQTDLEQEMLKQGHLLGLNAIFIQRINKCVEVEGLLNHAVEWINNLNISENVEPKVPLLFFGIIQLSLGYCEKDETSVAIILYKFAKTLLQLSEEKGSSRWSRSLLNAIGISKQDTTSYKFLCRALSAFLLAQLPEMKNKGQIVRREANAAAKVGQTGGNSECAKILMNLNFGQSQGKLREFEEFVLAFIQDEENSLHNANYFLTLLTKQFYIKPYLKDFK